MSSTDVRGNLNYAGAISGRPRFNTVNPADSNLAFETHDVFIRDVRHSDRAFTLAEHGFEFIKHTSKAADNPDIFATTGRPEVLVTGPRADYSAELVELVRSSTGAKFVIPQVGSFLARASERSKAKASAGAANLVHLDYTHNSAAQLRDWTLEANGIRAPSYSHFTFIQTWRALSPGPQDSALCICDGSSIPATDAVPIDAIMGDPSVPATCFEFRLCKYSDDHSWHYLSNMQLDDLLLFKGFDSRVPQAMNAMHSAFDNPLAGPDAAPRRSIEARFLAFYE